MADGRIWFNTKIDNSGIEKDLRDLERKIKQSQEAISKAENAKLPLAKQLDEAKKKLDDARNSLSSLKADLADTQAAAKSTDPAEAMAATAALPEARAMVAAQEKEVEKLQKNWVSTNDKVAGYDRKIQQANIDIDRNKAKAAELTAQLNSNGVKMQGAFDKARNSANRFGKRMLEIAKSVLVFSVVSSALRGVVSYMGKVLKSNSEYTAQLAKLKGALLTAFQPVYEFILPGVMAVLRVLTAIAQVTANVLSFLFGKTAEESAKNAKALNAEAAAIDGVGSSAKKAKKSLAAFDEINTVGSTDNKGESGGGGSSGVKPDFGDFNTDEYKAKIDELTVYLSGALLALGAILVFSGANIPLGIGLMAAGAAGLASVIVPNWDTMSEELKGSVSLVLGVLGGAFLAIGAILAFSGASIPKGIALMALGAAALGTTAALNWNAIKDALQGPIGTFVAFVSGMLLAIGMVLAFTGANIPLGIALIAAGAAGLVTVTALNWNAIKDKLVSVWNGIKTWFSTKVAPKLTLAYWKAKFSNIADGLKQKIKDGINSAITLFNRFISWINSKMRFSWSDKYVLGQKIISAGSMQLFTIPSIPYLAKGAVIPPNAPFMAMLGDQRHGTNIEAPLSTIQEAVAAVMQDYAAANLAGHEATVAVLRDILEAVLGIEIGDKVIADAVKRYNSKMAVVRGG